MIRFPHVADLFDLLVAYFVRNVPGEFWLDTNRAPIAADSDVQRRLEGIVARLEEMVQTAFENILLAVDRTLQSAYIDTFFWLLEDWFLSKRLQQQASHSPSLLLEVDFERTLTVKSEEWNSLVASIDVDTAELHSSPQTLVSIRLQIYENIVTTTTMAHSTDNAE